jgi:transcriptional regulator
MYLPTQFNVPAFAEELMIEHPFASLVSTDDEGFPYLTHLPLHLDRRGEDLYIIGHCARANPHWKYLQERPEALIAFLGPQSYMSPSVYPDLARVPTWNYLSVQVKAEASIVEGHATKDIILKQLIADHEPEYAAQWRALPDSYTDPMLSAIVAFELKVLDVRSKFKLNQHRPEAHAKMYQVYANGNEQDRSLAGWMARLGMNIEPKQA